MTTALDPTAAEALVEALNIQCDFCRTDIVWTITVTDASMPVDAHPNPDGNILLLADGNALRAAVLGRSMTRKVWQEQGHALRTRHALTCPRAEEWRHKTRRTSPPTRRRGR